MEFIYCWITTSDFADLKPINVYHKEGESAEAGASALQNYHTHFRKKFVLDDTENVYINISADDYYKLSPILEFYPERDHALISDRVCECILTRQKAFKK